MATDKTFEEGKLVDKVDFSIKDAIENAKAEELERFKSVFCKDEPVLFNHDFSISQDSLREDIDDLRDEDIPNEEELNKQYEYIIEGDDLADFEANNFPEDADVDITEIIEEYINVNYGVDAESFTFEYDDTSDKYIVTLD